MGPGLFIKAMLQGSFSLMVFGWAQILMDIQPLLVMVSGEVHLHGFSHTYLGASLLGVIAALSGKPLSEYGLVFLGIAKRAAPIRIAWWVAFSSAFLGTFSHVALDSVMHGDMQPLYPFTQQNRLLGLLSWDDLHLFCLISGLVGVLMYFLLQYLAGKHAEEK